MLRYQMVLCWASKPPTWEEFFPDEEAPAAPQENPDERMMLKLTSVMAPVGSTASAVDPELQAKAEAFREKMQRLMGVTE